MKRNTILAIIVIAVAVVAGIAAIVLAWQSYAPIEAKAQSANDVITLSANINEPMDIQPAGGYKLLNDTINPQSSEATGELK